MKYFGIQDFKHSSPSKIGILLVNLGTPDAPTKKALKSYLREFLSDPRIIEISRPLWWIILNLFVLPTRPAKSAKLYQDVWTKDGSPLLFHSKQQAMLLQQKLNDFQSETFEVELGMSYGNPSVSSALKALATKGANQILVLPLFPQYSGTTTGSVFDIVAKELTSWRRVPSLNFVADYYDHPLYINALVASIKAHWETNGRAERLLFSFHGIPKRYFMGGDPYFCHCQKTARLVGEQLGISREKDYWVTFQSLFGKEEWLKPYTDETLKAWGADGLKSIDVVCPGFVGDCLETLEEIAAQNKEFFKHAGGGKYSYIPALNESENLIELLAELCLDSASSWLKEKHIRPPRVAPYVKTYSANS